MLGFGRFVRSSILKSATSCFRSNYNAVAPSTFQQKLALNTSHLEVCTMVDKQLLVPNSFALLNIREMLLKSRGEAGGLLEEIDALVSSQMLSGIISTSMDHIVGCMNNSIRIVAPPL